MHRCPHPSIRRINSRSIRSNNVDVIKLHRQRLLHSNLHSNVTEMKNTTITLLFLLTILLTTTTTYLLTLSLTKSFLPSGTIQTSSNLAVTPNTLDWGTITNIAPVTREFTLTNNRPEFTNPLNLTAPTNIGVVTWNGEGAYLGTNQNATYTITLTPNPSAPQGPFNFTITING